MAEFSQSSDENEMHFIVKKASLFELPEIVEVILSTLEVEQLKTCRTVNHLWNQIAMKTMKNRTQVRVPLSTAFSGFFTTAFLILKMIPASPIRTVTNMPVIYYKQRILTTIHGYQGANSVELRRMVELIDSLWLFNGRELRSLDTRVHNLIEPINREDFWNATPVDRTRVINILNQVESLVRA